MSEANDTTGRDERVKPLEWRDAAATDASRASSQHGDYYACAGEWTLYRTGSDERLALGDAESLAAAKAACDADNAARISSALAPSPSSPPERVTATAMEADRAQLQAALGRGNATRMTWGECIEMVERLAAAVPAKDPRDERTERRRNATVIDTSGGHEFVDPTEWGSTIPGVFCRKCLFMRRADGKNGPCKGPARLSLREMAAEEDNQPLSVGGLAIAVSSSPTPSAPGGEQQTQELASRQVCEACGHGVEWHYMRGCHHGRCDCRRTRFAKSPPSPASPPQQQGGADVVAKEPPAGHDVSELDCHVPLSINEFAWLLQRADRENAGTTGYDAVRKLAAKVVEQADDLKRIQSFAKHQAEVLHKHVGSTIEEREEDGSPAWGGRSMLLRLGDACRELVASRAACKRLLADSARLSAEVAALKGVVDKLQYRTVDGQPVYQGATVYYKEKSGVGSGIASGTVKYVKPARRNNPAMVRFAKPYPTEHCGMIEMTGVALAQCYSTEALALAAASAGPAREGGEDHNGK